MNFEQAAQIRIDQITEELKKAGKNSNLAKTKALQEERRMLGERLLKLQGRGETSAPSIGSGIDAGNYTPATVAKKANK